MKHANQLQRKVDPNLIATLEIDQSISRVKRPINQARTNRILSLTSNPRTISTKIEQPTKREPYLLVSNGGSGASGVKLRAIATGALGVFANGIKY